MKNKGLLALLGISIVAAGYIYLYYKRKPLPSGSG